MFIIRGSFSFKANEYSCIIDINIEYSESYILHTVILVYLSPSHLYTPNSTYRVPATTKYMSTSYSFCTNSSASANEAQIFLVHKLKHTVHMSERR